MCLSLFLLKKKIWSAKPDIITNIAANDATKYPNKQMFTQSFIPSAAYLKCTVAEQS